jgi:hypothetical protein
MISSELFEDFINKRYDRIYFNGVWSSYANIIPEIEDWKMQFLINAREEVKNSIEAKKENAYNYIELILEKRKLPRNDIRAISTSRENNLPLDMWPNGKLYEKILFQFANRRVTEPTIPGHVLKLAPETMVNVLRMITDFNEDGYQSIVINRDWYDSDKAYFDKKLKKCNEQLTIGDCFKGNLKSKVAEYENENRLIGYHCECLALPIHPDFRNCTDYFDSEFSRAFAIINPNSVRTNSVSLKIVDYSPFGMTIILPEIYKHNTTLEYGDSVQIQVFGTYQIAGKTIKFGTGLTNEEKFNEYLLWHLNNHFFLRYDLKRSAYSYDDMSKIKNDGNFIVLLKTYKLASNASELLELNITKGEQNNGVLYNKILNAKIKLNLTC